MKRSRWGRRSTPLSAINPGRPAPLAAELAKCCRRGQLEICTHRTAVAEPEAASLPSRPWPAKVTSTGLAASRIEFRTHMATESPFGLRLKALRQQQGLSQAALAGNEISTGYLSRLESGARNPTERVIAYLAQAAGRRPFGLLHPAQQQFTHPGTEPCRVHGQQRGNRGPHRRLRDRPGRGPAAALAGTVADRAVLARARRARRGTGCSRGAGPASPTTSNCPPCSAGPRACSPVACAPRVTSPVRFFKFTVTPTKWPSRPDCLCPTRQTHCWPSSPSRRRRADCRTRGRTPKSWSSWRRRRRPCALRRCGRPPRSAPARATTMPRARSSSRPWPSWTAASTPCCGHGCGWPRPPCTSRAALLPPRRRAHT